jgi:hypothetical protein
VPAGGCFENNDGERAPDIGGKLDRVSRGHGFSLAWGRRIPQEQMAGCRDILVMK